MGVFAQITQGPATTTGQNTNKQSLLLDRQNAIVETVGDAGIAQALQTAITIQSAQTALVTITAAQNLFTKLWNAGIFNKLNRCVEIVGQLIYTSPGTTTPTISIALTLGGVTLCTITTTGISATASTNMPLWFMFTMTVVSTGATATLEVHGTICANLSANTPAAAVTQFLDTNVAVSAAVNLVAAATMNVTIAASSAVTSAQLRMLQIEIVN